MSVLAPAALSLVETQCVEGANVGQALYPFTAQPSEQMALPLPSHEESRHLLTPDITGIPGLSPSLWLACGSCLLAPSLYCPARVTQACLSYLLGDIPLARSTPDPVTESFALYLFLPSHASATLKPHGSRCCPHPLLPFTAKFLEAGTLAVFPSSP